MELELEAGGGGSRVVSLSSESPEAYLGSGDLVPAPAPRADRTVSRRHVSLRLVGGGEPRVAFEVVGRNPVVVRSPRVGEDKVYRRGEAGELRAGDGLSLSLKAPAFWTVRRPDVKGEVEVDTAVLDAVARREKRTRERREKERERRAREEAMEVAEEEEEETVAGAGDDELDEELEDLKIDLGNLDPVQEFGFLSMGHEFDKYPKGRIRPPKDWNWFLEEIRKGSDDEDDDDVSNKGRKSRGGGAVNKKKKGEDEDEEWTDESEDGKDSQQSGPSVKRSKKYVTRSKEAKKPRKESSKTENKDAADEDGETEEEDEEDETLGGFIVKEEDEPMDKLSEEEEDEEEEFDDEDEDD